MENWPKPLPDARHSHAGWTWGSMGSVYAETPDRIWVAQRGELPLPEGAKPWTPYAALNPSRGVSNSNTDENGRFLDMWPLRSPDWPASIGTLVTNHIITADQFIWAGDAGTDRILKYDLDGNFLCSFGAPGPQPGRLDCPHGLSTDQRGNLFVADCFGGRLQKFAPQPGADLAKLVGAILRYPVTR